MTVNPLVVSASDRPGDAWSGVWIAEDVELIAQGVRDGSWVDGTLGVVGAGLDALALISDPVGALLQYGVAWLIEHVKPLSEALDWLAGDPGAIGAQAQTWRNVAGALRDEAAGLARAVRWDTTEWEGAAGDAYRAWAGERTRALDTLAGASEAMAAMTEGAGMLIAAVRVMVRDAIAVVVSRLIVYAAEEVASFGLATPLLIEQVTTLVASWAAKISRWLRSLIGSLRNLAAESGRLARLIERLKEILGRSRSERPDAADLNRVHARGSGPRMPINRKSVRVIAEKYGIDLAGIPIEIRPTTAGLCGVTRPDGSVILCRTAFRSEEDLARTLEHERFHVEELRGGRPYPGTEAEREAFEDRAYAHEDEWWNGHDIRPEGVGGG